MSEESDVFVHQNTNPWTSPIPRVIEEKISLTIVSSVIWGMQDGLLFIAGL